ncbi:MAG: ROK family protein [Synergistaceae bacterium]|nr:ROK family protein [Synergistaceae bacterium]
MKAIGVDLGGHNIAAGLVAGGSIEAKLDEPTEPARKPGSVIAQIARMVRTLSGGEECPVGVCIPGGLDAARENAVMVTNFAGWNGLPIRRMLEDAIGGCVAIENDANAYALGEGFADAGAAKGADDYVMVTLGTGIGGGVVMGGRLMTGAHGMAGELGHMVLGHDEPCGPGCRGLGHFEALCGADALERKAAEMGLMGAGNSLKDLWLRRGEPGVAAFWDTALENLARGLASLVHIFDPELLVVGGGLSKGKNFMALLEERVPKYVGEPFRPTLKIRPSLLDTDAPIFGGACCALSLLSRRRSSG